jgi:tetratricopeptide (TPR) repeat protein
MSPARLRVVALILGTMGFAPVLHGVEANSSAGLIGEVRINTPTGQPASGVEIGADGANPKVTDSSGRFKLEFVGKRPGEAILLRINKPGWLVVNREVAEEPRLLAADPALSPVMIIVSPAGEHAAYARQFAERRIVSDLLKANGWSSEGYAVAANQARLLAEEWATMDERKRDPLTKDALRALLQGDRERASQLLAQASAEASKEVRKKVDALVTEARVLALKGDASGAERKFQEAVKLGKGSFNAQFALAVFELDGRRFDVAAPIFKAALDVVEQRKGEPSSPADVAGAWHRLGICYMEMGDAGRARDAFEQALRMRRDLVAGEPEKYRRDVAGSLFRIALLDLRQGKAEQAASGLGQALASLGIMDTELTDRERERAYVLDALASAQRNLRQFDVAQGNSRQALAIRRRLASVDPDSYGQDLANSLTNSCNTGIDAPRSCEEAVRMFRLLAKKSPSMHESSLISALGNLAAAYQKTDDRRLAKSIDVSYAEAVDLSRRLAQTQPALHLHDFARLSNAYAGFLMEQNRLTEAEAMYAETGRAYDELAARDLACYQPKLARMIFDTAILYSRLPNSEEKASAACRKLSQLYPGLMGYGTGCIGPNNDRTIDLLTQWSNEARCSR